MYIGTKRIYIFYACVQVFFGGNIFANFLFWGDFFCVFFEGRFRVQKNTLEIVNKWFLAYCDTFGRPLQKSWLFTKISSKKCVESIFCAFRMNFSSFQTKKKEKVHKVVSLERQFRKKNTENGEFCRNRRLKLLLWLSASQW